MSAANQAVGFHAATAILERNPAAVRELLLQHGRKDRRMLALRERAARHGVACRELDRRQLDELADGPHQGVVALLDAAAARPALNEDGLLELLAGRGPEAFLLVLDSITDARNLGACLRSAAAAGVDAVVIPADRSARLNAAVRKAASGAAEVVPVVTVSNLARFLGRLKPLGIWISGADSAAAESIFQGDLTGPVALVLGSEGKGIRRLVREQCDYLLGIPMPGATDSLNVAVAAGICLFEVVRQRRTVHAAGK